MRFVVFGWEIIARPLVTPLARLNEIYKDLAERGIPTDEIWVDRDLFEAYHRALHHTQRLWVGNGLKFKRSVVRPMDPVFGCARD